ncbi:MAG TPA: DUF6438 domain-containing protein [Methanospirillum sp.]|nr:DUF6438 domain-containing protein [Methanospirillum sp.]
MKVFAILLACFLISPSLAVSSGEQDRDIEITLERGMCFGTCPVYSVSLYGNGTIAWEGGRYVEVIGNMTATTDPAMIGDLYDRLIEGGFMGFADSYAFQNITDMPTATLTVRNGTVIKAVYHYHGDFTAPENLSYMENAVDRVANTSRWIGTYTYDEGMWGEPI